MDPTSGDTNLLKFLALGRLAKGSSAGAVMARSLEGTAEERKVLGKHQILAYASASRDEKEKVYKKHVKEVMSKGASRLAGGKRVRLISDEETEGERYELNVLTEYIDEDPNLALVFFAITTLDFNKHQPISGLFKDFKTGVYGSLDSELLATAPSSGPVHARLRRFLEGLFVKYNTSALRNASRKVEEVKEVMKDNVARALGNVEQLEEMEVKAESMENAARNFERNSSKVLWLMRCRYWKITALVALVGAGLLAYLIYYIDSKVGGGGGGGSSSEPEPAPLPEQPPGGAGTG